MAHPCIECSKKMCLIPQRFVIGIMCCLAVLNAYTMRVALNMAITEMVTSEEKASNDSDSCPVSDPDFNAVKDKKSLYDWDQPMQGLILGSFFWGYVITHIPGGILAEQLSAKYTLSVGLLLNAILTLLSPILIQSTNGNVYLVIVVRIIQGFGQGVVYPALNVILAKWVPLKERGMMGSFVFAGAQIGTIVGNFGSAYLISGTESWDSVFYFFGGLGLLWVICWQLLCYSTPQEDPFISEKELEFLEKELSNVSHEKLPIPWVPILKSAPLWALVVAQLGHDWGLFTMVTDLPKYMKGVLKFKISANGVWSSMPYLAMWITSMLFGWFSDLMIKKGCMGVTNTRKLYTSIGAVGPGIFMVIAVYSGCNRNLAVGMFTVAMALMGAFFCGMKVNAIDLAPNFAGTLMAIVNGIGALSGIITPFVIGKIAEHETLSEWKIVFWITFAVLVGTTVIFVIWGTGETQSWNGPKKEEREE